MLAFICVGEQGYIHDDNIPTECGNCLRKGQSPESAFVAVFDDEAGIREYMCRECVKAGLEDARSYYEAYLQALGAFKEPEGSDAGCLF